MFVTAIVSTLISKDRKDYQFVRGDQPIIIVIIHMVIEQRVGHPNGLGTLLSRVGQCEEALR